MRRRSQKRRGTLEKGDGLPVLRNHPKQGGGGFGHKARSLFRSMKGKAEPRRKKSWEGKRRIVARSVNHGKKTGLGDQCPRGTR